jgi:signal transduction histidine kinase
MLARADANDSPTQSFTVDLSLMLNTVADQFESLANEKHITLERAIVRNLHTQGNQDQLIQVVFNLVDNAVKYSPPQAIVRIKAHEYANHVEIIIEDNGPGISADVQSRVFDRFYRSDQSRERNQNSFGLGLAIVKRIVMLHNGSIRVVSNPGSGAKFVVTLPLPSRLIPI